MQINNTTYKAIAAKTLGIMCFLLPIICNAQLQKLPKDKVIIKQMISVADWQLAQKWSEKKHPNGERIMGPNTWEAGAFYPGILEVYRVTKNKKYLDSVKNIAILNNYKGGNQLRNGDHQAIFQSYLELYEFDKNPVYLSVAQNTLDSIMANPKNGAIEYSWCDLLFMAPPIWSRYAAITKQPKYLDFQDKIFWEAVNNLQDTTTHLFYRDNRFKTLKSVNGNLIFWSRGNGWVIAGLARLLEYMPKKYPNRKRYENLLIEMATALKPLQQADGFWKSNLVEPTLYPMGETSGTAFFCYAIAWGINQKILSREEYLPVVEKSWNALNSFAVHPDGKLGFVQPGGDRPYISNYQMSNWYSAGAFLMAGKQILKLN